MRGKLIKALLIMVFTIACIAGTGIWLMVTDANYIHRSVMHRDHTHYTKLDIDFKKETCLEFYDNGSWLPVYVCQAR